MVPRDFILQECVAPLPHRIKGVTRSVGEELQGGLSGAFAVFSLSQLVVAASLPESGPHQKPTSAQAFSPRLAQRGGEDIVAERFLVSTSVLRQQPELAAGEGSVGDSVK